MKINRKKRSIIRFDDLPIGECFIYDNQVYIKIRDFKAGLTGYEQINAFNFESNSAEIIYNDILVERIEMKLDEV